jgi:3-deoxy-D-manno-octulosonic acid kinase
MVKPSIKREGTESILYDGDRFDEVSRDWFFERHWRDLNSVIGAAAGRGHALFVRHGEEVWALRHYHRGGIIAQVTEDRYLWMGTERTRAFREWRLLAALRERGLPVPRPIAARVSRNGISYKADILTVYLKHTHSLAALINSGDARTEHWTRIGRTLRQFHDHGVDHADLNARNILLDEERAYLVDFDRGGVRSSGGWRRANLRRLERSLRKIALETGAQFDEAGWCALEDAYQSRP